jgi:Mg-chelatase subunit ChlD
MRRLHVGALLLGAWLVCDGCSSSDQAASAAHADASAGAGGTATGGSGGAAAAAGSGGSAGTGAGETGGSAGSAGGGAGGSAGSAAGDAGGGDAGPFDADFTYDAPVNDALLQDACVDETASAEPVPLDIYFMLDRSGSMTQPFCDNCSVGDCDVTWPNPPTLASRWCNAINAIAGYVQDPSAQGNRAALEYFYASVCSGYDVPSVGLVDLTAGAAQLIGSLNNQTPYDGTPTRAALEGLAAFTAANQQAGRVIIGILITDGDPTTCAPTDNNTMRAIVENHFNATGIHTFVVGMDGATFGNLENWASYPGAISHPDDPGNTCGAAYADCHHWNVGNGDPTSFIAALQQIQQAVLGCTFNVPIPSQGVLDPDKVAVDYDANGGSPPPPEELVRVSDAANCTGADNEWHYDSNTNPTVIQLCPATCARVQTDTNASVQVRIACQGS